MSHSLKSMWTFRACVSLFMKKHPGSKPILSSENYNTILCVVLRYVQHYGDVIMGTMVSQMTSLAIVYSTVYSGADQRKHQSSVSLAFVWGIHRGPVNSPHKGQVTRKMFPFDDVITGLCRLFHASACQLLPSQKVMTNFYFYQENTLAVCQAHFSWLKWENNWWWVEKSQRPN